MSADKYPGLGATLAEAVTRRNRILCLAPADGKLSFDLKSNALVTEPNASRSAFDLNRVVLARDSFVKQFGKQLDTGFWSGQPSQKAVFEFGQADDQISIKYSESDSAWAWVELDFRDSDALQQNETDPISIMFCGLAIVDRWFDGRVALYLLWRIIEDTSRQANH